MRQLLRPSLTIVLCCLMLGSPRPARADSLQNAAVGAIVGIVVVSAAITVGVVLLIKHHPSVKGCAADGPDGLQLTGTDGQVYALVGDTDGLEAGDCIRVSGKRTKGAASGRKLIVEKSKVYGPCPARVTP